MPRRVARLPMGYLLALVAIAAATLLRLLLPQILTGTPFLAFYPAVVIAAAYGGLGPGLTATFLGAAMVGVLFDPNQEGWANLLHPLTLARLSVFIAGGVGVSVICARKLAFQATERRQAEELRQSHERYAAIHDHAPFGVALVSYPEGRLLEVNEAWERLFESSREEAIGKTTVELGLAIDPEWRAQMYRELGERQSLRDWESPYRTRSGKHRILSFNLDRVEIDGRLCLLATAIDITQQKQAEERVRLQAAALEAAANGITITDAKGTIIWVNHAYSAMTGYSPEETIGQSHRLLKSGQQTSAFYEKLWRTIQDGKVWHGELVNRRKDGTLYVDEQSITPLTDDKGAITHYVAVKQDVTPRKRAEEALAASQRSSECAKAAAEEATKAKDHFLAVLSHELRTPLTPVAAALAVLAQRKDLDGSMRETLEMAQRNVEMEARLIDDLLDVTRIARGKIEMRRTPTQLDTAISRALEVCRPDVEARGLHLQVDWGERPYWVHADPARLQQVFWNIVKNAVKFTPHGGCVGISCRRETPAAGKEDVVIEVVDSGIGIEHQKLGRVFDAFEQAEPSITRQFGGLGLGLAISRALVELHQGSIEAHSEGRGKGATFRVRLPLLDGAAVSAPGELEPSTEQAAPRPMRILLVEDHGDTANIMRRLLEVDGHEVATAGDVATALELAQSRPFDLLLSDLGLPDASGLDLMRELRGRNQTILGIALSGYGQEQDLRRSYDAGFAAHLTKPTTREQLSDTIAAVTAGAQGR